MNRLFITCVLIVITISAYPKNIIIGEQATEMERYAAQELRRYIYQLSGEKWDITTKATSKPSIILGQRSTNETLLNLISRNGIMLDSVKSQGYLLKYLKKDNCIVIAANSEQGVLYGIYGLLDDHYGIGFYLTGNVLPRKKSVFRLAEIDELRNPRQTIRGVLPWTNFPQSATSYSMEDWEFILDQMAKMRMNLLDIHNYNGMLGHNEMFHNFEYKDKISRVWNATAKQPHAWGFSSWNVNEYLFGADALFDDYDWGADMALHNDKLADKDLFRKGKSQFQRVIDYAHKRGVNVALGIEINLIPDSYGVAASTPEVVVARTNQIINDYPLLDYLLFYRAEVVHNQNTISEWEAIMSRMYERIKKEAPGIKMGVSGWGLNPAETFSWTSDIICAPISPYSASFEPSENYGTREYWGCPWLERDFNSSSYYYPYFMDLSQTIDAYRKSSANMAGFQCLTWRVGDAVEAKSSYIAKAPWDVCDKYKTSTDVYMEYAVKNYGKLFASKIVDIIDQNEPFAVDWAECAATYGFTSKNRAEDIAKAQKQIDLIDECIVLSEDSAITRRLNLLKCRLEGVKYHCMLDQDFVDTKWDNLSDVFSKWAHSFVNRVCDISSLGNVVSSQNRYVKLLYKSKEDNLRSIQKLAPPVVTARATQYGAELSWTPHHDLRVVYEIFRNGVKVNSQPVSNFNCKYNDTISQQAEYTIQAITTGPNNMADTSLHSMPQCISAGDSDNQGPAIFVISPPASTIEGKGIGIIARVLDNRKDSLISAKIFYRYIGDKE